MKLSSLLILQVLVFFFCGCEDEKPYTPFAVAQSVEKKPQNDQHQTEKKKQQARPAAQLADAPPLTRKWSIFGSELVAPEGLAFVSAIQLFAETALEERAPQAQRSNSPDKKIWRPDVYAWLAPAALSAFQINETSPKTESLKKTKTTKSELLIDRSFRTERSSFDITGLYRFDTSGRAVEKIASLPQRQPLGGSCKLHTKVLLIGEQTVFLQHDSSCKKPLLSGQAPRSLQIMQPQRGSSASLLNWYLLTPLPGEKIQIGSQARDLDQDGHEDFSITVSLTSPQGITESADFSWVVRAAGASQEANLPYTRLKQRVDRLNIASMRIKERVRSTLELDAFRRLLFAVCKGSETEKVLDDSGSPLECGDVARLQAQITLANIRAAAAQGQFARALGHYEHALWSTHDWTASDKAQAQAIVKKRITHKPLGKRIALNANRLALPGTPHASPFLFYRGKLLVIDGQRYRQLETVSEKRKVLREPNAAPLLEQEMSFSFPAPHSLILKSQSGALVQSALASCSRAEVQIAFIENVTQPPQLKPVFLLAPRPAQCHSFGLPPLPISLIGFSGQYLNAVVAKELVSTGGQSVPLSVVAAYGTSLGLVVQGNEQFTLYTSEEVSTASHCQVGTLGLGSSEQTVVACLQENESFLYHLKPKEELGAGGQGGR